MLYKVAKKIFHICKRSNNSYTNIREQYATHAASLLPVDCQLLADILAVLANYLNN